MIIRNTPSNVSPDGNDVENVRIRWYEDVDCCSNWFGSSFLKLLYVSKIFVIFAFVYANSIVVCGTPIQTSKGVLKNGKLHQSFRRDGRFNDIRTGSAIPISISIVLTLLVIFGCIKGRRRRNREVSSAPQELTAGQLVESTGNPTTDNRDQSANAPGAGRARRARPRPLESSTHSLLVYAKEPGESERIILESGLRPRPPVFLSEHIFSFSHQ